MSDKVLNIKIKSQAELNSIAELEQYMEQLNTEIKSLGRNSAEFKKVQDEIRKTSSTMKELDRQMEGLDVEGKTAAFGEFAGGINAAFTGIQAIAGDANKDMVAMIATVQRGMAITEGIKGATEAWTAAQKVLNVVMAANPIGLLIAGVAALAAGILLMVNNLNYANDVFKKSNEIQAEHVKALAETEQALVDLELEYEVLTGKITAYQAAVIKNERETAIKLASIREQTGRDIRSLLEERVGWTKEFNSKEANILARQLKLNLKNEQEYAIEVEKIRSILAIKSESGANQMAKELLNIQKVYLKEYEANSKLGANKDKVLDEEELKRKREEWKKYLADTEKAFDDYNNRRKAKIEEVSAFELGIIDRYKKLMQTETQYRLELLEKQYDTEIKYIQENIKDKEDAAQRTKELETILKADVAAIWADDLNRHQSLLFKKFAADKQYIIKFTDENGKALLQLDIDRYNDLQSAIEYNKTKCAIDREMYLRERNLKDTTNEEKLKLDADWANKEKQLQAELEIKLLSIKEFYIKKAKELKDKEKKQYEQRNDSIYQQEINSINDTLAEKEKAIKESTLLEEEQIEYIKTLRKQAEEDIFQVQLKRVNDWLSVSLNAIQQFQQMSSNLYQIDLEKYTQVENEKLKTLQKNKDMGLITEEEYNEGVEALNNDRALKEKELKKKYAGIDLALTIAKIIAETAQGVVGAWAQVALLTPAGSAALSALIAGVGATQIGLATQQYQTIQSLGKGGVVDGPSHDMGGVQYGVGGQVTELEGGEGVINKRSMSIPWVKQLASELNQVGGYGVAFARGGITPGTATENSMIRGMSLLTNTPIKAYVISHEVTNAQEFDRVIKRRTSLK